MSSEQDRVRELAERVARKLSNEPASGSRAEGEGDELGLLRASLAEIRRRLDDIESQTSRGHDGTAARQSSIGEEKRVSASPAQASAPHAQTPTRSMWLSGTYMPATEHPSQEQFTGIGEAVSELVEFFEREKTCNVEPGGKPCDHCGLCSSRGF
ncbi:MAG TPA: hypothetical protein VLJ61_09425 [Pyrinomonadaceae bacterium]|nr:hypothetical protein [Pyrinomonadaceae bacterium]